MTPTRVTNDTICTCRPQGDALAKIRRIRPKQYDAITESIKLILDMPLDLSQEARHSLANALGRFAPPETWGFVMLNPEQQRLVVQAITAGQRPFETLRIWNLAISHIRYDTGEIMAGRKRLAQDAGISLENASRALSSLVEIGALLRLHRGRYAINPHVGWTGSLLKRQEAAKTAAILQLVDR
jgi:hypothetical protein